MLLKCFLRVSRLGPFLNRCFGLKTVVASQPCCLPPAVLPSIHPVRRFECASTSQPRAENRFQGLIASPLRCGVSSDRANGGRMALNGRSANAEA
jgi:hypothetical protein